jgi:hypothetical protein
MINLLVKTPAINDIVFSETVSISYEVKDTEGVFNSVVFEINGNVIEKSERISIFPVTLPKGSYSLVCYIKNKLNKEILSTRQVIDFSTEPITLELKNKLSSVVSSSIPNFLEQEYEVFAAFIKEYYSWLEQTKNVNYIPHSLELYFDIDTIPPEFLERFKETYLFGMPNKFAKDFESGSDIDLIKIIKRIRDFYNKKGTEDSFRFLFRIMFDTEITLSYPREKLLYASQGRWRENNTIKIKTNTIEDASNLIGKEIYVVNNNQTKTFSAIIDDVYITYVKEKSVVTAIISNIVGELQSAFVNYQEYVQGNIEEKTLELYSMIVDYSLTGCDNSMTVPAILGTGQKFDFQVGQKIQLQLIPEGKEVVCLPTCLADVNEDLVVDGVDLGMLLADWGQQSSNADFNKDGFVDGQDLGILLGDWGGCELCVVNIIDNVNRSREVGYDFFAIVDSVDEKGNITKIKILNSGVNYTGNNISRYSTKITNSEDNTNVSYDCRIKYTLGYIFQESGRYISKKSLLSELGILQDNFYYQQNSYEIGSSANPLLYTEIMKQNVHPAGYKSFHKYDILSTVDNSAKINFDIEQY